MQATGPSRPHDGIVERECRSEPTIDSGHAFADAQSEPSSALSVGDAACARLLGLEHSVDAVVAVLDAAQRPAAHAESSIESEPYRGGRTSADRLPGHWSETVRRVGPSSATTA
jgi:hypothetical protein